VTPLDPSNSEQAASELAVSLERYVIAFLERDRRERERFEAQQTISLEHAAAVVALQATGGEKIVTLLNWEAQRVTLTTMRCTCCGQDVHEIRVEPLQ
jgi:hypothetical protein